MFRVPVPVNPDIAGFPDHLVRPVFTQPVHERADIIPAGINLGFTVWHGPQNSAGQVDPWIIFRESIPQPV